MDTAGNPWSAALRYTVLNFGPRRTPERTKGLNCVDLLRVWTGRVPEVNLNGARYRGELIMFSDSCTSMGDAWVDTSEA